MLEMVRAVVVDCGFVINDPIFAIHLDLNPSEAHLFYAITA